MLLFKEGDLPIEFYQCQQKILSLLKKDAYWNLFPIVIESYITINHLSAGDAPMSSFGFLKTDMLSFRFMEGCV